MNNSNGTAIAEFGNESTFLAQPTFWIPFTDANGTVQLVPLIVLPGTLNGTSNATTSFAIGGQSGNYTELAPQQQQFGTVVENVGVRPLDTLQLFLILFGLVGNSLTALTIWCADMLNNHANKYICTMVLADSAYLLCALVDAYGARTFSFPTCAFLIWLSSSAVYISSTCVVLLAVERALAIFCPLEHMQTAHLNRWLFMAFAVLPLLSWELLLQYATLVDTSSYIYDTTEVFKCVNTAVLPFAGLGSLVSNSFHFLLPLVAVVFLNAAIVFKLRYSPDMKFLTGAPTAQTPIEMKPTSPQPRLNSVSTVQSSIQASANKTSSSPNSCGTPIAMPPILFIAPLVYVLLNSPFYAMRFMEESLKNIDGVEFSVPFALKWAIENIYLANFASNAIVYALASSFFRRKIIKWIRNPVGYLSSNTGATASSSVSARKRDSRGF